MKSSGRKVVTIELSGVAKAAAEAAEAVFVPFRTDGHVKGLGLVDEDTKLLGPSDRGVEQRTLSNGRWLVSSGMTTQGNSLPWDLWTETA